MNALDSRQRRLLVALACKVAWADGVVTEAEQDSVRRLVERFAGVAVAASELDAWLTVGAPDVDLAGLPDDAGELFFHEALEVMRADGDVAAVEMDLLWQLMTRVFDRRPKGTPIARIALAKRKPG